MKIIIKVFENKDLISLKKEINNLLAKEQISSNSSGQIFADPKLIQLFEKAEKIASSQKDSYVSIDSLLISTIESEPIIDSSLKKISLTLPQIKKKILEFRKNGKSDSESSDDNFNALEKYTINVTQKSPK
jgi:ATP-dependent Clp protease ATP-binding subunit ClpB